MRLIAIFIALLLPSLAWAAADVFQVAADDKSMRYLGYVFGKMGILQVGTYQAEGLFGELMSQFNTIVFSLGLIIIAYTIIIGTMHSAQEGEPLGKKWGTIWTPARSIFGLLLMIPWKSGYCFIQIAIMWCIIQGVGAANGVWEAVLDYYNKGNPANYIEGTNSSPNAAFASYAKKEGWLFAGQYYRELVKRDQKPRNEQIKGTPLTNLVDNSHLDAVGVDDIPGLKYLIIVMGAIEPFMKFIGLVMGGGSPIPFPLFNLVAKIPGLGDATQEVSSFLWGFVKTILGGEYLQTIIDVLCSVLSLGHVHPTEFQSVAASQINDFIDTIGLFNTLAKLPDAIVLIITNKDHDIIENLASLGSWLTNGAETLFFLILLAVGGLLALSGWNSALSPVPYATKAALSVLVPILVGGITLFWVLGVSLAIYIPMVPYLVFTFAAVGWILLVIESIIAAPLIALIFIVPSEDEMGKAGNALVILLGLILRPMLMILGFILAIKVLNVAIYLLAIGFVRVVNLSTIPVHHYGFFGMFAVIFLFVGLITSVVHQSFSLIYKVPDRLLRWMGGMPEDQGDIEQQVRQVGGSVEGAGATGKAGMSAIAGKLGKSIGGKKT